MSKKKPKVQAPVSTGNVIKEAIGALPDYYSAAEKYQPMFNALNLSQVDKLLGSEGGLSDIFGLLRTREMADVNRLAGEMPAAMRAANPNQYALLDSLNQNAQSQLGYGDQLSPDQIRNMQQASRAAAAARGMSGSNMAVADEMYRQFDLGNSLRQQRQQYALGVGGLNQAASVDPFNAILGMGNNLYGYGTAMNSSSNPMSSLMGMAHDNQMSYWNAKNAASAAGKENKTSMMSGMMGAGATLGAASILAR